MERDLDGGDRRNKHDVGGKRCGPSAGPLLGRACSAGTEVSSSFEALEGQHCVRAQRGQVGWRRAVGAVGGGDDCHSVGIEKGTCKSPAFPGVLQKTKSPSSTIAPWRPQEL